jgi:Polymerase beta, Nucleotidyltransferase
MRRGPPLPADIENRLARLGPVLAGQPGIRFAYVFGGAARQELRPLSDIDLARRPGVVLSHAKNTGEYDPLPVACRVPGGAGR